MTTDHFVRLRDGRSLSYAQYGDPAGFPILSAHGGLACRLAARDLGRADGAVLRTEGYDKFASMSREALRQPQGVVEEYRAMNRPWGFAPEDLSVPVDVWAGRDDQLVDRKWSHELARRIPNATMHLRQGGHFLAHLYYRDIFDGLLR
jgi:pimeloyl-ACP methyl ester carboxylesterase